MFQFDKLYLEKKIHSIIDFLILRIKQIQRKNENLKKTIMHLQKVRTKI